MQHDLVGSGHDRDLRSNFIFDIFGSCIHHSTRLDELNTIVVKSLTCLFGVQSYYRKTKYSKIGHFHLS